MLKSLYIASTQGSGGKTTIAVGLCLALRKRGLGAGYFKPVGTLAAHADGVLLDEDAEFVAELLELEDDLTDVCPVVLDEDALHDVLSGTEVDAMARVKRAYERIRAGKDIVVCEGLGEIWQGRFLRTSGAEVVAELDLGTLLVAKFAGARLLDDIIYVKDALKQHLLGVLFNMVPESRLALVQEEYTRFLARNDIESYGALVSSAMLSAVSVAEIVEALGGTYVTGERYGERLVETYMIGAMSPEHALRYFQLTPNKVVIVGGDRAEIVLAALDTPTVAVVLTGNYVPSPAVLERADERGVPLVSVETDTVSAADGMRRLFGRLRVKDRTKIELIAQLIEEQVDLDRLVGDLQA
ncbi:MAG TPA: phosphotransacetylase family protein [Thermoleophilia bacterium]